MAVLPVIVAGWLAQKRLVRGLAMGAVKGSAAVPPLKRGHPGHPVDPEAGLRPVAVTTGIVHFGVGGFHRAHQAMYLDRLMDTGEALDWGICGVG